jgi:two-component system cell cycle response regulator CpdR
MARILIAEHNQTTADYLYVTLKKAGYDVEAIDNSLDAWRMTSREVFDVLMVDIAMPGIDGFILSQKALQENPSLQIIFITGFAGVAMDTYATPPYAPAPITTRPFHLRDIVGRIRYMMGYGNLPVTNNVQTSGANNVVYANFLQKGSDQQALQQ